MSKNCEGIEKCPIFNGVLKDKKMTTKSYQIQYCTAGEEGYSKCKRLQVKQRYGVCPPDLLPNSSLSIEQIAERYDLS